MSDCSGHTSSVDEAIEREELSTKLAEIYMAGMRPSGEQVQRALELGLDPDKIREAVDACYEDTEEDTL